MQLISLYLENYRQHKSSEMHFPTGLVGILGSNGSGKSTILEAIAWAIYGNEKTVVKGGKDTLIWRLAPPKSVAIAELSFAFAGRTFTIKRTQTADRTFAELQQDGRTIANSIDAVKSAINKLLNMTHQEFFNSYFTGQKDLKFLGGITSGADRERFIAKMLGYERIEQAQGEASKQGTIRHARSEASKNVHRIQGAMEAFDPEAIATNLTRTNQALHNQRQALTQLEQQIVQNTITLNQLQQHLQQLQDKQQQFNQIQHQIELKSSELKSVQQRIDEILKDSATLAKQVERYNILKVELINYQELLQQERDLRSQYDLWQKQQQIAQRIAELEKEIEEMSANNTHLQELDNLQLKLNQEIAINQERLQQLHSDLEQEQMQWQNNKALTSADLRTQEQLSQKLQKQIRDIEEAGSEGHCPTCDRPLYEEYETVISNLQNQLSTTQALVNQRRQELHLLKLEPTAIGQLRQEQENLKKIIKQQEKQQQELALHKQKSQIQIQQITAKQSQIEELTKQVTPTAYDPVLHQSVVAQIDLLSPKHQEMLKLENTALQLQKLSVQLEQNQAEKLALEQAIAKLQEDQTALHFNLSEYSELQPQYQQLQRQQQQLLENRQHTQHQIELLTRDLELFLKQEQEYQAKKLELANAQNQYLLYDTLDRSFTDLRQYLTQQIRPQLSEIASLLLAELTDGRYSALELDDGYNVAVIESGDRKSVISGGEEDIVNLCLRLAVSQMIMDRTGQPFSLLILDEVFGSLDEQRRDNVLQLLHKLGNQFAQVLVISHIDLIKESLNHAICLEYLPKEQYSRVVVQ